MRLSALFLLSLACFAQRAATFETRPATALENEKIELLTLNKGGAFVSLILKDDAARRASVIPWATSSASMASARLRRKNKPPASRATGKRTASRGR